MANPGFPNMFILKKLRGGDPPTTTTTPITPLATALVHNSIMQNLNNSQRNGILHKTSSPYHPKGNGMAERTIQTSRKVQKKARKDGIDPNLEILELCNTPRDSALYSDVFVDAQEHFCQLVTSS